jgi:hypothetical protein
MNGQQEQGGGGFGWIILLVILYIIFNPIPGPIDDAAVAAVTLEVIPFSPQLKNNANLYLAIVQEKREGSCICRGKGQAPDCGGREDFGAISDEKAVQRAYLEIINPETEEERRGRLKQELLDYCKLDTRSMMRLAKFFEAA